MLYRIAHFLNRPLSGDFSFQTQLIAALRSGLVVFGVMLLFTGSQVTTDRPAWFVPGRKFRYPDIMVAPIDDNEDTHVVHNAVLTVEVIGG
ncbi:MAG: hypothetical protein H7319_07390 [Spirosoma sp.]|nr:hypothetical protein [Spirosoma sp.]